MKRISTALLVIAVSSSLAASLADASGGKTKLQLRHTKLGMILVNARGFTLYSFSLDRRNRDACQNQSGCLIAWPPVLAPNGVSAGKGLKGSLIGTIRLKHGKVQVTYNGRPLYTYVGDSSPGETANVNILQFHGFWPAVNAKGQNVK
jgi:predicted lipoprotein with Yx(FWY)xxD motif